MYVAKTKALISFAVTAKLVCSLCFRIYAKRWFSHDAAQMEMSIQLRSSASGCFVPPRPKRECFKQSMRYSGCLIWNSLPTNVKRAQTADTIHNRCLRWLTQ